MNLWSIPVESIEFEHVDAFLKTKRKEGLLLDYKADVPDKLARLVAAFANTNGGLIVLGIDADKATNEPNWPPLAGSVGLRKVDGIPERIEQICRDNINPPIQPLVSRIIDNPHLPGHALVIVRVDESREAPHATDDGRRIYERTGSVNDPIDFAHVDRIANLLNRRRAIGELRDAMIEVDLARARRQLADARQELAIRSDILTSLPRPEAAPQALPFRWVSVVPLYPWRKLCKPEVCREVLDGGFMVRKVQRIPDGAFAIRPQRVLDKQYPVHCASIGMRGNLFCSQLACETAVEWHFEKTSRAQYVKADPDYQQPAPRHQMQFGECFRFLESALGLAKSFLKAVELPGHLLITFGILDALGFRMETATGWGAPFVNEHFRAEWTTTAHAFLGNSDEARDELLTLLAYGFDFAPESLNWKG